MLWLGSACHLGRPVCLALWGPWEAWAKGLRGLDHPTMVGFICAKQLLPDCQTKENVGEGKVSFILA